MRPIAVVGGTGMLGRPVVDALVRRGVPVRVLTRAPPTDPLAANVCYVVGSVTDKSVLKILLDGCSAVHISLRGTGSPTEMWMTEVEGSHNVTAIAKKLGVERITYLSGAGIEAADPRLAPVAIKLGGEYAARKSGLDWTIFRATHFMESLDMFVRGNRLELMTPQPQRFHYLAARDYADIVARVLVEGGAEKQALTVLGPEPLTMREALDVYRERLRPDLRLRTTPTRIVRIVAALTRNPGLRHAAMLFSAFPEIPETGDRNAADYLLGRAPMALAEWCDARRA